MDYDGDGYPDILLLNGHSLPAPTVTETPGLRLYHNNRNGTFTDVTAGSGLDKARLYAMGLAVGDYDNDGRDDVYISCVLGPSHLFRNETPPRQANGKHPVFRDVTALAGVANAGMWGTSCCWVDYDRDGYLDLFICNYVRYRSLKDDLPCFLTPTEHTYCLPNAFPPSRCTLYHNNHDGTFTDVSQQSGIASAPGKALGVAIWDYDGDGLPDIFVANDTVPGFLFHNLGKGRFEEVGMASGVACDESGTPHSGMGIDATDAASDGKTHLVIANYSGVQTSYYEQIQPGVFQDRRTPVGVGPPSTNLLGFGAFFFDYDNDGWKDLLVVNGHVEDDIEQKQPDVRYAEPPLLYHNRGDGTYTELAARSGPPLTRPIVGRAAAHADIDNDGREDVLVTTNGGPAYLWRNQTRTAHHWLTFRLVGVKSNRDGIGALVTVMAGGRALRDSCRSGSSYLSANDLRVHFGLGAATQAEVTVRWPSGREEHLAGLAADRIWTLREGSGKAE
ncbi:MAG TPA: CRTAC1 family protein [Chthonomonadaceae bacterium]|nr:CRTAC1 family protein [Chthonomonadaceae bacterium]